MAVFATRHALDVARLEDQGSGQRPLSIEIPAGAHFDGRIEAIRLMGYGRVGNTMFSLLNALLVAQALQVNVIELPSPNHLGVEPCPLMIHTVSFSAHRVGPVDRPTLVGDFFYPGGLEPLVGDYSIDTLTTLVRQYLHPVYRDLADRPGSLGGRVIALHFRGGDIFAPGFGHLGYVQPPASYYLRAVEYAQRHLAVDAACLVFEDFSNPAVILVAEALKRRGLSIVLQSSSTTGDLSALTTAHHLVAPYGTFCEAAAMLSPVLKTITSFRRIGTQRNVSYWTQARFGEVMHARGIRTFVIDDPDATFTQPDTWRQTTEQLNLIKTYPEDKLRHREVMRLSSRE